jgi:hypothetical protein
MRSLVETICLVLALATAARIFGVTWRYKK